MIILPISSKVEWWLVDNKGDIRGSCALLFAYFIYVRYLLIHNEKKDVKLLLVAVRLFIMNLLRLR